jgi:hypothetical protein
VIEPTARQEQALGSLAEHLMNTLGLQPSAFFGHCDFGKPASPGNTTYGLIEKLRGSLLPAEKISKKGGIRRLTADRE